MRSFYRAWRHRSRITFGGGKQSSPSSLGALGELQGREGPQQPGCKVTVAWEISPTRGMCCRWRAKPFRWPSPAKSTLASASLLHSRASTGHSFLLSPGSLGEETLVHNCRSEFDIPPMLRLSPGPCGVQAWPTCFSCPHPPGLDRPTDRRGTRRAMVEATGVGLGHPTHLTFLLNLHSKPRSSRT
jgi:hypothetical protein